MIEGKVSEITIMAEDMHRITVQLPQDKPFIYKPGDYVFITMEGYDARPYSIANAPRDNNTLDFFIKRSGHGLTAALCDELTVCGSLTISKPQHQFDFPDDSKAVDFLTGGMGITPFLGMIESYQPDQPPLRLYWGVESKNDLYFMPFLEEQRIRLDKNFDIVVTVAEQDGNILDSYIKNYKADPSRHTYISGPKLMVQESVSRLLANGAKDHMIHYDVPTS